MTLASVPGTGINHKPTLELIVNNTIPTLLWLSSISTEVRQRISDRISEIEAHPLSVESFFSDPVLPESLEDLTRYIERVNRYITEFREKNPTRAYYFLTSLYQKLHDRTGIHPSPVYLNFMWELCTAASHSADFSGFGEIVVELEGLIDKHQRIIDDSLMFNPDESANLICDYRSNFINPVLNLAYFFARKWRFADAEKYADIGKKYSRAPFRYASRTFDFMMLAVLMEYSQWNYSATVFTPEATQALGELKKMYTDMKKLEEYYWAELEYNILHLLWRVQRLVQPSIWDLAEVIRERDILIESTYLDDGMRQLLLRIQILIYIASQECLKGLNWDWSVVWWNLDETEATDYAYVVEHNNKINTWWFDIDRALAQDNAWFFLWWLVDLFCYRVSTLESGDTASHATRRAQILHMMLDIYRIAAWSRNSGKNLELFRKRPYFQEFIAASKKLLWIIGIVDMDNDHLIDEIWEITTFRDALEDTYYATVKSNLENKWKVSNISICKLFYPHATEESPSIPIEHDSVDIVGTPAHTPTVFEFTGTGGIYRVKVNFSKRYTPDELEKVKSEIEKEVSSLLPILQKRIAQRNLATAHTNMEITTTDIDTHGRNQSRGRSANFGKILSHLWQLGIPRDSKMFFDGFLDIWWIAVRIPLSQVTADMIIGSTGVPMMVVMEGSGDPSISIQIVWALPNGDTIAIIRYGILPENHVYNLPPYDSGSMVRLTRWWTLIYQDPLLSTPEVPKEEEKLWGLTESQWTENERARRMQLYRDHLDTIKPKFWMATNEWGFIESLKWQMIYSDQYGSLYDVWSTTSTEVFEQFDEKWKKTGAITTTIRKKTVLIQVKGPDGSPVQLLATFYRQNGKNVIYIGGMISTGKTDVPYIGKWFSSLIDHCCEACGLGEWRKNIDVVWERNGSYGKEETRIPFEMWHKMNSRRCKEEFTLEDMNCRKILDTILYT